MKKIVMILPLVLAMQSSATIIPNTSENELRLGDGIKVEVDQRFPTCLADFNRTDLVPEDRLVDGTTPTSSRVLKLTSEVIRSFQSLDQYTHQSISADVQYLAYSGSASYTSDQESKFSREQITVGIQASADYGRYYIPNPQLRPEYANLAQADVSRFYSQCGFEFVSGVVLGQGVSVILRTLDSSSYDHSSVSASAEASVEGVKGSGSISAAFASVATNLMKYSSLEVFIYAYGAGDLKSTTKVLTTEKDVKEIVKVLSEMINQINPDQAVVTSYMTSPYPIAHQPYKGILGDVKRQSIHSLYSAFRGVSSDLYLLKRYVNRDLRADLGKMCEPELKKYVESPNQYLSCEDYSRYLEAQVETLHQAQSQIAKEIKRCAENDFTDLCRLTDVEQSLRVAAQDRYWPSKYKRMLRKALYWKTLKEIIQGGRHDEG